MANPSIDTFMRTMPADLVAGMRPRVRRSVINFGTIDTTSLPADPGRAYLWLSASAEAVLQPVGVAAILTGFSINDTPVSLAGGVVISLMTHGPLVGLAWQITNASAGNIDVWIAEAFLDLPIKEYPGNLRRPLSIPQRAISGRLSDAVRAYKNRRW